jgi:hypothetical protein
MAGRSGGGIIVVDKEFDRGTRGAQTKEVEVAWGMFLGAPDENAIAATVKRSTQAGWLYVAQ